MPSGSLDPVVQPVGADTSRYKAEWLSVLPILKQVSDLQKEIAATGGVIQGPGASLGAGAGDIAKTNASIRETLASLKEYQAVVRDTASVVGSASAGYETMRASISEVGSAHADAADAADDFTASLGEQVRAQQAANDAAMVLIKSHLQGNRILQDGSTSVRSYVNDLGSLRDTARDTASALGDTAAAVTAATSAGSGGSATSNILGDALAARVLAGLRTGGGSGGGSANAIYDAMNSWGPQGGGGGGGGGFLGGFFGGIAGGGAFPGGAATQAGNLVTGFLGTWVPRIHYALMATNEILATVGPSVIAAGAAAAVGLEGGQTAYGRLSAVNTVGQSLGPALGQTPGQFLGLGDTLQKAQTLADPAVWELLGAAKNIVSAPGSAGAFTQLGTNTIDMIDRFAAKVTSAFTGGEGKQLGGLVQQGTQYLQQFGDIAGNIGLTFLHAAPVLPGVGGDLLSTVQGITRGLAVATGGMPPALLGGLLAAEAGGRYGPALLGTAGNYLGRAPGGIFGTTASTATADDVLAGRASMVGETIAGTGAAGALGSVGFLDMAALGATAYAVGKTITAQSPTQQWIGRLQSTANQANLTQAYGDLLGNITQFSGMSGGAQVLAPLQGIIQGGKEVGKGSVFSGLKDIGQSALASLLGTPNVRTPGGQANAALTNAAAQFNDLLSAGPAIQGLLGGGSLQNAYNIADMAGLQASQLSQLVGGSAKQKADIRSQLLNEQAGYAAMASSPGVYGMNVNAVQAMGGLAGTKLSTVNSAWDQILQNATGGTASATGFAAGAATISALGKSGVTASALTGFTSPAAQAAWAAFSSPSTTAPGALQQAGSMADWMRTAMTVSGGKISQGMFDQTTGFELKQLLPYAKSSPAALAQLGVLSQQMTGGVGYDPNKTQAENYKAISKAIDGAAGSAKQYNKDMNDATIATAGVSQQALNFGSTMKQNVYSAMSGGATGLPQVSKDMQNFKNAFSGGVIGTGALGAAKTLAADFASVRASAKDVGAIIPQALQGKGLSAGTIATITEKVKADVSAAEASINSIHGKTATVMVQQRGAATVQEAIDSIRGKAITITVTEAFRMTGSPGGVPLTAAGIAASAPSLFLHRAIGGMVPGTGSGDHVPALLEPGEAIVPKYLVPLIAPILRSHHVPGFAAGGYVPYATYEKFLPQYDTYKGQMQAQHKWYDSFDQWYAAMQSAVAKGTVTAAKATGAAKSHADAAKAQADANKIATSINYARSVSNATVSGLGIAGMNVDPTSGNGSVAQQMGSYLGSIKAFTGDLGTLGKQGLNKTILQQLIGAGPVQGDALAQSILTGPGAGTGMGGVAAVNALYRQIQAASRGLGGAAAGAMYGGHPSTSGGQYAAGGAVTVNVNVGGGGGSGGGNLTTAQIKQITEQVQAALLKQAKRNRKTGLQLPGYGA